MVRNGLSMTKHLWRVGPELILNPHLPLLFLNKSLPSVCHPGVILSRSLPINLEKFSRASFGAWHPTNLDTYIHKTEMTDCDNCPGFCAFPTEFSVSKKLVYVLKKTKTTFLPTNIWFLTLALAYSRSCWRGCLLVMINGDWSDIQQPLLSFLELML